MEMQHVDEQYVSNMDTLKLVKFAIWRTWYKTNRLILFSLFLIYPVVASTILRLWVCKDINDTWYLLADFRDLCYDARWHRYANFGAVMIVFYPVGIPLLFAYKLITNRTQMQRPGVKAALGFFYGSFYPSAWWFELVDITHKLILVSLIAFFPSNLQLPFAMSFVIIYMIIILVVHPYKQETDDLLHLQAQIALFLYIYAGFMLQRSSVSDATDVVLSIILIGILIFLLIFAIFYFVRSLYNLKQVKKTEKDYEAGKQAQAAGVADEEIHGNVKHIEMDVLDRQASGVSASVFASQANLLAGGASQSQLSGLGQSRGDLLRGSRADLMNRQISSVDVVRLHAQQKLPSGLVMSQLEERQRMKRNSLSMSEASN